MRIPTLNIFADTRMVPAIVNINIPTHATISHGAGLPMSTRSNMTIGAVKGKKERNTESGAEGFMMIEDTITIGTMRKIITGHES